VESSSVIVLGQSVAFQVSHYLRYGFDSIFERKPPKKFYGFSSSIPEDKYQAVTCYGTGQMWNRQVSQYWDNQLLFNCYITLDTDSTRFSSENLPKNFMDFPQIIHLRTSIKQL